jgi:tetratricopeptide (TPR) repeat protein
MSAPYSQDQTLQYNQAALEELQRAMGLRPGRFSLILVRCNYTRLRGIVVGHLQQITGAIEVFLPPRARTLRHSLATALTEPQPPVVLITGLEAVQDLTAFLQAANLGRNELRKAFPLPLVLWVNDLSLQAINHHAPDLKSFATTPIDFDYPPGELVHSLHQEANRLFLTMLSLGDDSPYAHSAPAYRPGSALRNELTFALADIEKNHCTLDPELTASLSFLKGRDAFSKGDLEVARFHFEQSLAYWQTASDHPTPLADNSNPSNSLTDITPPTPPTSSLSPTPPLPPSLPLPFSPSPSPQEKQAVLLFYLGAIWRSLAALQRSFYQPSLQQAKQYFESCLDLLRTDKRLDLVGKFIHALAEIQQKLGHWAALAATAREGMRLHSHDPVRLARDYGYLAEVALATGNPKTARAAAQWALDILKIGQAVQSGGSPAVSNDQSIADEFQRGWYLYLLAQVEMTLGHPEKAIQLLEEACAQTLPQRDLALYRRILETLRQQYYHQKAYLAAFHIKQEQRQVETRFKLRAFVGASHIQPYESLRATVPDGPTQALLATEIAASGRQADVDALVQRLAAARYPLLILHGPSGVGKSSLLYGGLVPALWKSFPEGRATLPVLVKGYRDWPDAINQSLEVALSQQRHQQLDETLLLSAPIAREPLLDRLKALTVEAFQQIVLIFDQFEEFIVEASDIAQRLEFYSFFTACLNIPYLKVVLVLREDFLHYLLEIEREFDLDILNHDILTRDNRYYLGNLQPADARELIRQLTHQTRFYLEEPLIDQLVADLSTELGEVRPIELQVVGAQLQRKNIQTLDNYLHLGAHPKEQLVQSFLTMVVHDCGPENADLANVLLYLLTDEDRESRLYRPLKSREDLEEELQLWGVGYLAEQLDLVLEILVGSGLVFWLPEIPIDRYQLVHDYLVSYVRRTPMAELVKPFQRSRSR